MTHTSGPKSMRRCLPTSGRSASRYVLALLLLCPLALCAKELTCTHKGPDEYWINKITIDTQTRKVVLDVGPFKHPVGVIEFGGDPCEAARCVAETSSEALLCDLLVSVFDQHQCS